VTPVPEPIEVRKVPIHSVSDASELTKLIDDGVLEASRVIAIIGKTEGNGGVNDYTRILADRAFREALIAKGAPAEQVSQIPIVWWGGTDGVISPHATIFATVDPAKAEQPEQSDELRLTVGFAMSEPILPEEIGYVAMVTKVAGAVKVAMERAGITDPADVHYVQTKTPLPTIHTILDAKSRGKKVWTEHTHESMDLSNGTTGLGIAVALGEIEMPTDADIMHNRKLYSEVASCSSGVELDQAQVAAATSKAGWSTCSSSARSARTASCTDGATRCWTTPTCTGTARSSRLSGASQPRSPATLRSSSPCRPPTRAPTVVAPWRPSSTSARATRPATSSPADCHPAYREAGVQ